MAELLDEYGFALYDENGDEVVATRQLTIINAVGVELALVTANGILVRDGPVGLDAPPPVNTTEAGYYDGLVPTNSKHDARPLAIPLAFLASNVRPVKAALASHVNVRRGACQLRADIDGRRRYLRNVYYQGGLEGDETQARDDWALAVLALTAYDPFWYEPEQSIVFSSPDVPNDWNMALPWNSPIPWGGEGNRISAGIPWNADLPWNSNLPWNGGAIAEIDVVGDVPSWPRFTFTGPATDFELVHLRTSERIMSDVPLGEGETIIVETAPGASRGIFYAGEFAYDRMSLDTTAEMQFEPGDSIAVLMHGTGPYSQVRVTWANRWLTPYIGDLNPSEEDGIVVDGGTP